MLYFELPKHKKKIFLVRPWMRQGLACILEHWYTQNQWRQRLCREFSSIL